MRRRARWRWNLNRKRRTYEHDHELHAYEDSILIPLLIERGSTSANGLDRDFPGRFHPPALRKALERLAKSGRIARDGRRRGGWGGMGGRRYRATTRTDDREEVA